jgi:hypothetical protein
LYEWETAHRYVGLILNELPKPLRLDGRARDLLYLRAAITRMDFGSSEKVRASFNALKDVLRASQADGDHFGAARSLCELCAFALSSVMRSRLKGAPSIVLADDNASSQVTLIASLARELLQAIRNTGTGSAELVSSADANLLRAYVYVTVLGGTPGAEREHSLNAVGDYVLGHCETKLTSTTTTDAQRAEAMAVLSHAGRRPVADTIANIRELCDRVEGGRSALEVEELRWLAQSLARLEDTEVSVASTI